MAGPQLIAPNVSPWGSVSPDGLLISYVDREGNLILREVHSGKEDRLTVRFANSREAIGASVLSRDSRWIAYAHYHEDQTVELRVIAIDSLDPRVVYRSEARVAMVPWGWSGDGKSVLATIGREAVIVALDEGSPRRLLDFGERAVGGVAWSPDGKWLAHDGDGRVTLFDLASGMERVVAEEGRLPMWSADGAWLCYQREGKLWRWPVSGGPAVVEREGFRAARPWGWAANGDWFYAVRAEKTELVVLGMDGGGPPERVATRFPSANRNPVWGPDGRLAYVSERGGGRRALVTRDLSNNEERELAARLDPLDSVAWAANAKALVAGGMDPKSGKRGWWRVDAESGRMSELFAEREFAGEAAAAGFLTADGRTLFYARGGEVRARDLVARTEERIATASRFAVAPNGRAVAVAEAERVVIHSGAAWKDTVNAALGGVTELSWGGRLLAGKESQLWTIDPLSGQVRVVRVPRNRLPGVSAHPAGDRMVMAVGETAADLFSVRIAVR